MEKLLPHQLSFGERLGDLIDAKKMDQKRLAAHLGVTQATISYWTTGKSDPSMKNLKQIAELFDVSIDQLVGMPPRAKDKRAASRVTGLSMEAIETLSKQSEGVQESVRDSFITSGAFDIVTLYFAKIKALSVKLTLYAKILNEEAIDADEIESVILTLKLALLEIKETRAKLSSLFSSFLDDYTDFSLAEGSIENIIEKNESQLEQVMESGSKAVIFDKI